MKDKFANEELISIVVPVYNVIEYLPRCVHSLMHQTYSNLEILLVDDGSTDGTANLCDELAGEDRRIKVFHKINGGSSSARNYGIARASGTWIGFVDSDDYVDADMYEKLYTALMEQGGKAAQVGRDEITPKGELLPDICIPPEKIQRISPEEFFKELLLHRGDCSFCTKLIRKDVLDQFGPDCFPVGILNEDFHLLVRMLPALGDVISLPGHSYHVFYRLGSNSRKEDKENFSRVFGDCVDNADMVSEIVKNTYPELMDTALRFNVFQRLTYLLHIPINQMTKDNTQYIQIVKYMRKNWMQAMKNPVLGKKDKIYHTLFAIAPKNLRKVHVMKMKCKKIFLHLLILSLLAGIPGISTNATEMSGAKSIEDADVIGNTEERKATEQITKEAREKLTQIAQEREIMALVYLTEEYQVKGTASEQGETVVTVLSGQMVNILDACVDDGYRVWNKVSLQYDTREYEGYILRDYLAVSDSRFLQWEEEYGVYTTTMAVTEEGMSKDIAQFPISYQLALMKLKTAHPNWTFVKMNTGLEWDTVIEKELGNKSYIYKTFPDWARYKNENGETIDAYGNGTWFWASDTVLKIYMDPRNGLTEDAIFQFEQLTYNEEYHTLAAMEKFLNNTFMNGSKPAPGMDAMTFAQIFWYLGKEEGREVSPFHLAARVLQEQGKGTSPLISGSYPGYEGYYNYFNIQATGSTNSEVIKNGLQYAKDKGWNNAYMSIMGGADFISEGYIKKGQDTLYLQKFNVNPHASKPLYTHQYMQNITAPTTEAKKIKDLYDTANSLNSTFVFKIPVFTNMPQYACKAPGEKPDPIWNENIFQVQIPAGYEKGISSLWIDGAEVPVDVADGYWFVQAPDENASSVVAYKKDDKGNEVGMYVWSLKYDWEEMKYIVTNQPELENLLSIEMLEKSTDKENSLRLISSISRELRDRLTREDGEGLILKEYGTLVMNRANRNRFPLIKDGRRVQQGMAYGTDAEGNLIDVLYETTEDKYLFSTILTAIPETEKSTGFSFRSYAVLEKNDKQYCIYGPIVETALQN